MSSHWRHRTLRICDTGDEPPVTPPATTPDCEPHEPRPEGYVARCAWADEMLKTHEPRPCAGCGEYLVWEPRENADG